MKSVPFIFTFVLAFALLCSLHSKGMTVSAKPPKQTDVSSSVSGCPVAGACPYYEKAKKAYENKKVSGCPLTSKCPYYQKHKSDTNKDSALTEDTHHCPLAGKCPFYESIKRGEAPEFDMSKENCPLAKKCPYYKDVKAHQEKLTDCPVMHGCPKYMKEHGKEGARVMTGDSSKCPYLSKSESGNVKHHKGCPALEKCPYYKEKSGKQESCPLKDKCPYYEKIKNGEPIPDHASDGKNCPMAEKCPYYKQYKEGGFKGCPAHSGCPYFQKGTEMKDVGCPYLNKMKKGGETPTDGVESGECPYMKAKKAQKAAAAEENEESPELSPTDADSVKPAEEDHDEL